MDYSFINDPDLRSLLEKKNKDKKSKYSKQKNIKRESYKEQKILEQKKLKTNRLNSSTTQKKKKFRKPSTKNLALATKQLASMLRTGLPLLEALNIISESNEDKTLKAVFKEASIGISRGSTLQENLQKHPEIFEGTRESHSLF